MNRWLYMWLRILEIEPGPASHRVQYHCDKATSPYDGAQLGPRRQLSLHQATIRGPRSSWITVPSSR